LLNIRSLLIGLCLFATACASEATPNPNVRGAATTTPPPWVNSADAISLDNVAQVRYLGRLDSAGTPSTVFAHALSPDGTRLAALDNELVLGWDLISGELLFSTGRGDAIQIFFSPDKTEVYTLSSSGKVMIHDAETGVMLNSFDGIASFNGTAAFHPEDGWLALGNLLGEVKIWDVLERQALAVIEAHTLQVIALDFSDDAERLVSAGEDGTVQVWDWRKRAVAASFQVEDVPYKLAFSPDGAQVAAAGAERMVFLTVADSTQARTIDLGSGGTDLLRYSPDGAYLLTGGLVQDVTLWSTQTGGLVARLPDSSGERLAAAFSPDGSLLLTSEMGAAAALWNMGSITERTLNRANLENPAQIFSVDWTSDSRLLTLFGATGAVYVWGIAEEQASS
jgi:WD40 repeat protein